jgi:excinuclease UvrABC helicase subunit UvrB
MNHFQLISPFTPQGDQPQAIEALVERARAGVNWGGPGSPGNGLDYRLERE